MIQAKQHLRRMRGGAQSHLMFAENGHYSVVRFQNNPQHVRVLANELLATRIAERVDLPVPIMEVIEVSQWLIENTSDLRIRTSSASVPCQHGLALGARFVLGPLEGLVFDYLPASHLSECAISTPLLACSRSTSGAATRMAPGGLLEEIPR